MKTLIQFAGLTHFLILFASASVPAHLDWKKNLATLPPFLRKLFWVYGAFIVLVILSFGSLTLLNAGAMAAGEPVARSLCAVIAIFWGARLLVQFFIFDLREFLTSWLLKVGESALTAAFIILVLINGWVAIFPGRNLLP